MPAFWLGRTGRVYSATMLRALLPMGRWIAVTYGRALAQVASRHPLAAEINALREAFARRRVENDLLRSRPRRLELRWRPQYRRWERLAILWHRARYGLSISATARAFVISVQTVVNWCREIEKGRARLVQAKRAVNRLPDLVAEIARRLKGEWS